MAEYLITWYLFIVLLLYFTNAVNNSAFTTVRKEGLACDGSAQLLYVDKDDDCITSPGFPFHFYPSNTVCKWNLSAPMGDRIHIKSMDFALEETASCLFDHLIIYDGFSDKFPPLGRFCSLNTIDVITSSNSAFLVFLSDMSYENRGFNITYRRSHQPNRDASIKQQWCNNTILTDQHYILSPDFPLPYPSNSRCRITLRAPSNFIVELMFREFLLEYDEDCNNDYLAVYDGQTSNAKLLGRFCGTKHPQSLRSNTNTIVLYFYSDEYFELSGYQIRVRFLSVMQRLLDEEINDRKLLSTGDKDCSGVHHKLRGEITSPRYPRTYPPLKNCITIIRAPANHIIRLIFGSFMVEESPECEFDWLKIVDGDEADSPVIGRYCADSLFNTSLSSKNHVLKLEFSSDYSVSYTGFSATYLMIKKSIDCLPKCLNRGVCRQDDTGHHCACPHGWSGKLCHIKTNSCSDSPCLYGGTCHFTPLGYKCTCQKHFTGTHCETNSDLWFTSLPKNSTVKIGQKHFLECGVNKDADITWTFDDDIFLEESIDITNFLGIVIHRGGVLEITSFAFDNNGKYTCTARSELQSMSANAWLTVNKTCPNMIRIPPKNATVLQGSTHHFTCSAENHIEITWEKDDTRLVASSRIKILINGILIVHNVKLSDTGKYTCVTRIGNGCRKRHVAWLSVRRTNNLDEVCGRVIRNKVDSWRITQGTLAEDGAHPWYALLRNPPLNGQPGVSFCGATVINSRWIVTAAHCILERRRGKRIFTQPRTRVYVGTNDCLGNGGIISAIEKTVIHPNFRIQSYNNDIALIKLTETLPYSKKVLPICLQHKAYIQAQFLRQMNKGTVVGCGAESYRGYGAKKLMQINVPLRSRSECRGSTNHTVSASMICAGYRRPTRGDACQGDSGGPYVMVNDQGVSILVGIVSWGEGCDQAGKYGYYTNVGIYYNWINEKLFEYGEV